jgi:hypothetical protein
MVAHLLDEEEFWGEFAIPTVWKRDLAYSDQHYWRGSIWGPTNYLVYQGLRRYGFHDICADLAEKSLALFQGNWEKDGHWHESYLTTGEGSSLPHYTWGTLLPLMAIEELVDADAWRGLSFGALKASRTSRVQRVPLRGDLYDVTLGPKNLEVLRNGEILLRMKRPARVTKMNLSGQGPSFDVECSKPTEIFLGNAFGNGSVPSSAYHFDKIRNTHSARFNLLQKT